MTLWALLTFVALVAPGVWGDDSEHREHRRHVNTMIAACLSDEGCARRLGGELAETNSSNSSGTSPVPLYNLSKRTTRVVELVRPGTKVPITGEFIVSAAIGVRGIDGFDPGISAESFETWAQPILMKAAMLAWDNKIIWDRPAVEPNYTVQFVWVDQCSDRKLKFESEFCKMPYSIELLQDLYFGNKKIGLPPSKALIGTHLFTEKLAHLSSMPKTPLVGFASGDPQLSLKDDFPYFMRVNTPDVMVYRISAKVFQHFGFTSFDTILCNDGSAQDLIQMLNTEYTAAGFRTNAYMFNTWKYTGSPPGSLADVGYLIFSGVENLTQANETAWAQSFAKKDEFDRVINAALEFNAHAHLMGMASSCNTYDIMNYLQMKGLIGTGHFWSGKMYVTSMYTGSYIFAAIVLIPVITNTSRIWQAGLPRGGFKSEFRFMKPFDGGVWVEMGTPLVDSKKYQEFAKLVKFLGANAAEYLEPDTLGRYPPQSFDNLDSALWRIGAGSNMIDAMLTTLYGINNCVVKYGRNFTPVQLQQQMLQLDFVGISSPSVRFDGNGDIVAGVRISNYVYPPNFTEHPPREMGKLINVGTYESKLTIYKDPVFFDGITEPPANKDKPCAPGMHYVRRTGACNICPVGQYTPKVGMAECELCPAGKFSNTERTSVCKPCGVGTFQRNAGSTDCETCTAGMYNDGVQQSECKDCLAGSASDAGAVLCTLCTRGKYAKGRGLRTCSNCTGALTTRDVGALTENACVCPQGTYRAASARLKCLKCPEGMTCLLGSDEEYLGWWASHQLALDPPRRLASFNCTSEETCIVPVAQTGYMTRGREPLRPFKCSNDKVCPGGPPGHCTPYADGDAVACGRCKAGARKNGQGCKPCEGSSDVLPFALAPIILIVAIVFFIWNVNRDKMMESKVALSISLIATIAISTLQTLAMFGRLSVVWFEPLERLTKALEFMQFDPEFLKPGCAISAGAMLTFLGRQLIPLLMCILCFIIVMVSRFVLRLKVDPFVDFTNAVGTIFYALFISMVSNSFNPLVCFQHPDKKSWSMKSDSSILCWDDPQHWTMVGIAIFLLFAVPMPYLALVSWATIRHSRFCREGAAGNNRRLLAFRFLFHRFNPDAFYYGVINMARGFLICLTPVVVAKDPVFQLCFYALIIVGVGLISNQLQPWKAVSANISEAVLNACLLLLLVCGAANADMSPNRNSVSGFALFICILACTVVGYCSGKSFWRYFRPVIQYDVSICANMKDCGAQARLLTLFLAKHSMSVCIPADMSGDVGEIFDVMKRSVKNLTVFLTRSCLTQPICAGQIAIAVRAKLRVIGLKMEHFVEPHQTELDNLPGYLDVSSVSLGQMSVDWDAVKRAYTFLIQRATLIEVTRLPKDWRLRYAAIRAAIIGKDKDEVMSPPVQQWKPPSLGMILVSGDGTDEYATGAAGIVALKISQLSSKVKDEEVYMHLGTEDPKATIELVNLSRAVIVVLSKGSLTSRSQLWLIQVGAGRLTKTGGDSPHRRQTQAEARMSVKLSIPIDTTMSSGAIRLAKPSSKRSIYSSLSGVIERVRRQTTNIPKAEKGFEVIPIAIEGFAFPSSDAYDVLFPAMNKEQKAVLQAIFERMPIRVQVDADDALLNLQIQAATFLIPGSSDTTTGSFGTVEIEHLSTTVDQDGGHDGDGHTPAAGKGRYKANESKADFKMVHI